MDEFTAWKQMVYNAIFSIADLDFQKNAWFNNASELSSSFVETISILYDDSFFVKFLEADSWKFLKLSNKLHEEMSALKNMIDAYNEPESHKAILEDPNWLAIVFQARKVILLFDEEIKYKG
ncbi:hypothetical protein LGH70_22945 [Hymenobacter sp. BT635]|uniref:Uncharacterized protein n=1 Tax=Hymenobacter nitidus TaxID=2880929 RepID=A0ABS8ANA8_9BACT|nr:hypothetical protein [Hymenobacter nitidus]MCB2380469.1 hypothetical protein [Hymenobacter nitidus]